MGVVGQDGGEGEQAGAGGDGGQGGRGEAQGQRVHGQGQALELGQVLHLELLLETHTWHRKVVSASSLAENEVALPLRVSLSELFLALFTKPGQRSVHVSACERARWLTQGSCSLTVDSANNAVPTDSVAVEAWHTPSV